MQLSGPTRKQLRLALQACYPTPEDLRIMVLESLSVPLQDVTRLDSMPTVTFNLIEWAIAKGRVTELVQAAAVENPHNEQLQEIARDFKFAKSVAGEVERVVLENVRFENVAQWLDKISNLRRCICRIEPQPPAEGLNGYGTGFLVARDVVLTNHHVRKGFVRPERVIMRFDYETDSQGIAVNAGRECRLAADWLLAESPDNRFDYALLRLAEPAGEDLSNGAKRGFIRPQTAQLQAGDPLLILQHPSAEPLKLSIGSVEQAQTAEQYIFYSANTKGGSSGSPCLNMGLDTIAIHHFGAQLSNRGVLWSGIADDLQRSGKLHFVS